MAKISSTADSTTLDSTILTLARKLQPKLVKIRRSLHQNPELSFEEFQTTEFLKARLAELSLKPFKNKLETGIITELRPAGLPANAPVVAIRTDIDALPITERTGLPFASKNPGKMHACGHDTHMATVLGSAMLLSEIKDQLPGAVRFLFQPAEEQPPGGARPLIAAGALKNVGAILGLHVDPRVVTGKIGLRDGATMASVTDLDFTIDGMSGHAARPQDAVDAISAACELVDSLQKLVSRETDPLHPLVLTFGVIEGGTARNVIAKSVKLKATLRAMYDEDVKRARKLIKRRAENVCRANGAKVTISEISTYPPLSNDARVNRLFSESFVDLFGGGKKGIIETDQVMGGEDFACYLEQVPGAMFRLGIRNPKIGATENWHSDKFVVDEAAIEVGVALLARTAIRALERLRSGSL